MKDALTQTGKATLVLLELVVVLSVAGLIFWMGMHTGKLIGNGEGWREKSELIDAEHLPTQSQLNNLIKACEQ